MSVVSDRDGAFLLVLIIIVFLALGFSRQSKRKLFFPQSGTCENLGFFQEMQRFTIFFSENSHDMNNDGYLKKSDFQRIIKNVRFVGNVCKVYVE